MTTSTQTIGNKIVTVRFVDTDNNKILDMIPRDFKMAFISIKGEFNCGMPVRDMGWFGNFEWTTLTDDQLSDKDICWIEK